MGYLPLALITMVGLGVHYFLAKVLSPHISSPMIALLSTAVYFPLLIGYIFVTKTPVVPEQKAYIGYAILIGIPMAIAVLALYLAISKGPVSVVMPIYALNATVTAILGMAVLHEPVTLPKILGLVFAVAALVLLSR
jgi:transporter family protein